MIPEAYDRLTWTIIALAVCIFVTSNIDQFHRDLASRLCGHGINDDQQQFNPAVTFS
jgi:hypothetical protein